MKENIDFKWMAIYTKKFIKLFLSISLFLANVIFTFIISQTFMFLKIQKLMAEQNIPQNKPIDHIVVDDKNNPGNTTLIELQMERQW